MWLHATRTWQAQITWRGQTSGTRYGAWLQYNTPWHISVRSIVGVPRLSYANKWTAFLQLYKYFQHYNIVALHRNLINRTLLLWILPALRARPHFIIEPQRICSLWGLRSDETERILANGLRAVIQQLFAAPDVATCDHQLAASTETRPNLR